MRQSSSRPEDSKEGLQREGGGCRELQQTSEAPQMTRRKTGAAPISLPAVLRQHHLEKLKVCVIEAFPVWGLSLSPGFPLLYRPSQLPRIPIIIPKHHDFYEQIYSFHPIVVFLNKIWPQRSIFMKDIYSNCGGCTREGKRTSCLVS